MRTIAALFLAILLAVLGYGVFWMVSLNYTTQQMKGALEDSLHARVQYGKPQWIPDIVHVAMELPALRVEFSEGPVRVVSAPSMSLKSDFFRRDRWTLLLPSRVELTLAAGRKVLLETEKGQLMWMQVGNNLTLRADKVRLLDLNGEELATLGDLVLERGNSAGGVQLNLASRPSWPGGEAVVSGIVTMPAHAFTAMVDQFGQGQVPGVAALMRAAAATLQPGDTVKVTSLSFKVMRGGSAMSGGLFGDVTVNRDMQLVGNLTMTSDDFANLRAWVRQAGLVRPRSNAEIIGANRFTRGLGAVGSVRMGNMQTTLTLNGQPVGPLPDVRDVAARLWPLN